MNDRLYRSRDDRVISGVAAGVADRLDADPALVRLGWALLAVLTGGIAVVVYVVLWIVTPEEPLNMAMPPDATPSGPGTAPPGPGTGPGFTDPTSSPGPDPAAVPPSPSTGPARAPDWREQRRRERDARRAARHSDGRGSGSGALVGGVLLVLVGSYFLVRQYVPEIDVDRLWPLILVVLGVLLVLRSLTRPAPPAGGSS